MTTHYIGFGLDCEVTEVINRGGLRSYALPFDFIFAYPCNIKSSLDKNFEDWLDEKYLEVIPVINGPSEYATIHHLYDNHLPSRRESDPSNTYAFFNHHNLLDKKDRGIFQRRIDRYRDIIRSEDKVVFIHMGATPEIMKNEGLADYYKDRKAETILVYLEYEYSDIESAKLVIENNDIIIRYTSPHKFGDNISKTICDIIRNKI